MSALDAWLQAYPPSTRGTYARTVAGLVAVAHKPVEQVTQEDVAAYHAKIGEQAPSTQHVKLSILSSLFAYLQRRGIRADNPMVAIAHRPKVDKKASVRWLTLDEQKAVIDSDHDERQADRNKAMVWLLLHGLRLAELVGLDVEDYKGGELRFIGKGGKSRIVPLTAPAQAALQAYLGPRRSGPMFRVKRHRISRTQVRRVVKSWAGTHPHALRHSFATRMVKATSLPQLQRLLGHSALSSTQIYVHLDDEDLVEAMEHDPLNEREPLQVIEGGKVMVGR